MNLFYIPALLLMLLFVAYPFSEAVRLSFTSGTAIPRIKSSSDLITI